jgi:hypothetical protein
MVAWLRDLRASSASFDPNQVRREVLSRVRADLGYATIRIVHRDGAFDYLPEDRRS